MRAQSPRQRASRLGRDSMGRPVWNRTYSAVIPCIVFACSHLPHHRISTAQKGHGCPFSTRALVFYHTLLENATSFSKKVRANSRKFELFSGNRFWKNLTTRCSGFPRLTRRAAGRAPRQSPANRRVNARSSPGRPPCILYIIVCRRTDNGGESHCPGCDEKIPARSGRLPRLPTYRPTRIQVPAVMKPKVRRNLSSL